MPKEYYLFVYFTGETEEGEQVYFSLSEDGFHWNDLNGGKPVLYSGLGEKGVRDPFILRSQEGNHFYIIATDLRIANRKTWDSAQYTGSRSIIVWESDDLIHWQKERSCEVAIPEAGCAWAPEAVYDTEKDAYMVFWASMVKEDGEKKGRHRIYCSYTKDFKTFTKPSKYIERQESVIDTTIIYEKGMFYRFSKDETKKYIKMDAGASLHGEFKEVHSEVLEHLMGVEGPAAFPLPADGEWCLVVDRFAEGKGYLPLVCSQLAKGDFRVMPEEAYHLGENRKRHGSILVLKEEEYRRMAKMWG